MMCKCNICNCEIKIGDNVDVKQIHTCCNCDGSELKLLKDKESIELLFDLMLKNGINLMDFILWVFENKVNNTEYIPAFIDELKERL